MSIEARIQGAEQLQRNLAEAPKEIDRRRRGALVNVGIIVRDEARRRIHSPSGRARGGIKYFVERDERVRIRPANRQAVFAQRSRGPNTTPPPKRSARAIAKRYGIPLDQARAVAIAIARRGTRGTPVMVPALRATTDQLKALVVRDVIEPVVRMFAQ